MKKNITKIIALFAALIMVCMSATAIYIPEDEIETVSPEMSNEEEVQTIISAIVRERMARLKSDEETEEEREIAEQFEANMFSRLNELGYEKRSYEEVCQIGSATRENVAMPYGFGDDLLTNYETFIVRKAPEAVTYNGKTYYLMDVIVLPQHINSILMLKNVLSIKQRIENGKKLINLTSTIASQIWSEYGVLISVGSEVLSILTDAIAGYVYGDLLEYNIQSIVSTVPRYVYISETNSTFEPYYSLGLITCEIDYKEYHTFAYNDYDPNTGVSITKYQTGDPVYDSVADSYFYNYKTKAVQVYTAGHGYEVHCPLEKSYYIDGVYMGYARHNQPLQDVYLYGSIHD